MQQGIPIEKAREIVKRIKDAKKTVQAVHPRRSGTSQRERPRLRSQEIIALMKAARFRNRYAVCELPQRTKRGAFTVRRKDTKKHFEI